MVFNSVAFLVFFILFFYTYWWVCRKGTVKARNIVLIVASYIFYGWWDWRFLSLIIISSLADFLLGQYIFRAHSGSSRKTGLILSLILNLGLLGFFKYFNFFTEGFGEFIHLFGLDLNTRTLDIILPVGISFYTFQTMSYTIDIYRGKLEPTRDPWQFFAFVSFFPQLVAGPIERATRFLPQFEERKEFNYSRTISGFRLILWGFFKKVVIADNLGLLADALFAHPSDYPGLPMFLGAILFAFQIYGDFSGYSDIAIGLGKTLGFGPMTNFRKPYFSRSFGEFWHRWHISLSTWFRDYVYIPLGGSRKGSLRTDLNLMITFLVSGLWHGANITFVVWGFLHGSALILEKRFNTGRAAPALIIFLLCCLFWIPFRAESFSHFTLIVQQLFHLDAPFHLPALFETNLPRLCGTAVMLVLWLIIEKRMGEHNFSTYMSSFSKPKRLIAYYGLLLAILVLGNFDVKPYFIYFQF